VDGLQKILLVEDNAELRKLYSTFFKFNHYDVGLAIDGDDALTKAKEFKPDIIFLDVMMPKKDGFEVLKLLRHNPEYGCTKSKIVILTNLGDATRINPDIRDDMDAYVIKSEVELNDLLKIAKSLKR
jgi:two-component system alkaline phosphatase synthesis response regulator PhoP